MSIISAQNHSLLKTDLKDFKVVVKFKVYKVDDREQETTVLGYFENKDVAEAFVAMQPDKDFLRFEDTLVLTNGSVGYALEDPPVPVKLFDDDVEVIGIKNAILAKLTPIEIKILWLQDS